MSEWINCNISLPPESHSVLLYIVQFHSNGKNIWYENILTGFYSYEDYDKTGFYLETFNFNNENNEHVFIKQSSTLRVIAWTLLPRKPYPEILKNEDWSG